jgi:tRNA A-37 threonylcarbamoyl transferase component Bud32
MARLVMRQGKGIGTSYVIPPDKNRIVIGRRGGTEVRLNDPKASRDHAEVVIEGDRLTLRDLKSRNGTLLNGAKLEQDQNLEVGDRIRIGETVIEVVEVDASAAPPDIPGYKILDRIGRGRDGSVYKARQLSMDRVVAVKVLNVKYSKNEDFVDRFLKEARGAASMSHPNIIHVLDANYTGKTYYVSMEYVDGTTVENMLRKNGQLSVDDTLSISIQAARGLGFAHTKNVVHRDIRPGTIMVTRNKETKIADLGLAKTFDHRAGKKQVAGSLHYMAPEQALGKTTDPRTDIYSLGATMYHMLTGAVPFKGDSMEDVLAAHTSSRLPAIEETEPDVPESVAAIVERMMARDPDKRYQSMPDIVSDLEKAKKDRKVAIRRVDAGASTINPPIPAVVEVKRKRAARRRIIRKSADVGGLVAVLIVAIVAIIGAMMVMGPNKRREDGGHYRDTGRMLDPTKRTSESETYVEPDVGWGEEKEPADEGAVVADRTDLNDVDAALDLIIGVAGGAPVAVATPDGEGEETSAGNDAAAPSPLPEESIEDTMVVAAPAAATDIVARHLGYCRPGTWEAGSLVLRDGTKLSGSLKYEAGTVLFKAGEDEKQRTIARSDVKEVAYTRPNNIDASMGDFMMRKSKPDEALKRYEKALKAIPGHPYLRVQIEACSSTPAAGAAEAQAEPPAAESVEREQNGIELVAESGDTVTRHLGYCRAGTWENGTLVLADGTKLEGTFMSKGGSVVFKADANAQERTVPKGEITEVNFARPNNIDASMGDFMMMKKKPAEALKRYQKALQALPGDPYLRAKIDSCKSGM